MKRKIDGTPAVGESTWRRQRDAGTAIPIAAHAVTRVLLCGDQPLYRSAMRTLVETQPEFRVAAECTNHLVSVQQSLATDIEMAVIDFDLIWEPGHDDVLLDGILQQIKPRPIVIVTSDLDPEPCQAAMRHGVAGIVLKSSGGDVLLSAMDSARRGQVWLERSVLNQMFAEASHARRKTCAEEGKISMLTPRERQIVEVTCTGMTNKQIAEKLTISEATVRHHLGSIFAKLGVSTRSELVVYGYRHNLTSARPEPVR